MPARRAPPFAGLLLVLTACSFPGGALSPTATLTAAPSQASPEPGDATALPSIPEEAILILEPGPGSRLVGSVHIAGIADPTFEQNLGVRLLLDDGSTLVHTSTLIQAELGQRGPFAVDVPFTITGERNAFIQVFDASARDGGLRHLNSVGVILAESGPVSINPSSPHPEDIYIISPAAGQIVSGGIVHIEGIGIASFEQTLVASIVNQDGTTIASLPLTVQAPDWGLPGAFAVDLPFAIAGQQPGRVVVADPSVVYDGEVHLASVEVILAP